MTENYLKDYLWKSPVLLQHRNLQIFWTDMWGKLKRQFASTVTEDFLRFISQIPKSISVIK